MKVKPTALEADGMQIGELSRRTGVSARLLRYYEEQGLLAARRSPNGYRVYDAEAVVVVRQVRALLDAGLCTEIIRRMLPCVEGEQARLTMCEELREVLEGELTAMDACIEGLRGRRRRLAAYLTGDGPEAAQVPVGSGG